MKKVYLSDDINIIRQAFSGSEGKGLLQTIVDREYEKNGRVASDKEALIVFYGVNGCPYVARLVEHIDSLGSKTIGSGSIDFMGVGDGPFSIENALSLQSLKMGDRRMSPLEWLTYLSFGFGELEQLHKEAFDQVCQNLVAFLDAPVCEVENLDD